MPPTPDSHADSEKASEFQADEYRILRAEIEERSKEQREMERNVVVITTAILSRNPRVGLGLGDVGRHPIRGRLCAVWSSKMIGYRLIQAE
jgi:hypothetical protein